MMSDPHPTPVIWFPALATGPGGEAFTQRLAAALNARGWHTRRDRLPRWIEAMPWAMPPIMPPDGWVIAHIGARLPQGVVPRGMPLVVTLHEALHEDQQAATRKGRLRHAYHEAVVRRHEAINLHRATRTSIGGCVTAVSPYVAEVTRCTFGVSPRLIANGVDLNTFHPVDPQRPPNTPFRVLYVGDWSAADGADWLRPTFQELGDGFELWFAEDNARRHRVIPLPDRHRCVGHPLRAVDMAALYHKVDAVLVPSRQGPLPMSAIEAQASGVPLVVADGPGLAGVAADGAGISRASHADVSAFVVAIRRLAADASTWHQQCDRARQYAVAHLDREVMIQAYIDTYTEVGERVRVARRVAREMGWA